MMDLHRFFVWLGFFGFFLQIIWCGLFLELNAVIEIKLLTSLYLFFKKIDLCE